MKSIQLTENFNLKEFHCKDGSVVPESLMGKVKELAENLQVLRDYLQKPITINSAYRSEKHNEKIGGKERSFHLLGMAADITVSGYSSAEIYAAITALIRQGKMKEGGIGYYQNFVHYDIRGWYSRW